MADNTAADRIGQPFTRTPDILCSTIKSISDYYFRPHVRPQLALHIGHVANIFAGICRRNGCYDFAMNRIFGLVVFTNLLYCCTPVSPALIAQVLLLRETCHLPLRICIRKAIPATRLPQAITFIIEQSHRLLCKDCVYRSIRNAAGPEHIPHKCGAVACVTSITAFFRILFRGLRYFYSLFSGHSIGLADMIAVIIIIAQLSGDFSPSSRHCACSLAPHTSARIKSVRDLIAFFFAGNLTGLSASVFNAQHRMSSRAIGHRCVTPIGFWLVNIYRDLRRQVVVSFIGRSCRRRTRPDCGNSAKIIQDIPLTGILFKCLFIPSGHHIVVPFFLHIHQHSCVGYNLNSLIYTANSTKHNFSVLAGVFPHLMMIFHTAFVHPWYSVPHWYNTKRIVRTGIHSISPIRLLLYFPTGFRIRYALIVTSNPYHLLRSRNLILGSKIHIILGNNFSRLQIPLRHPPVS